VRFGIFAAVEVRRRVRENVLVDVVRLYPVRKAVGVGEEQFGRRKLGLDVVVVHLVDNRLRDVENNHAGEYGLVHLDLPFSEVNHGQIVVDDLERFACRLADVAFGHLSIGNELNVGARAQLLDRLAVNGVTEQLVEVLFEVGMRLLAFFGVELDVRREVGLLLERQHPVDLLHSHAQLRVQLKIAQVQHVLRFVVQVWRQHHLPVKTRVGAAVLGQHVWRDLAVLGSQWQIGVCGVQRVRVVQVDLQYVAGVAVVLRRREVEIFRLVQKTKTAARQLGHHAVAVQVDDIPRYDERRGFRRIVRPQILVVRRCQTIRHRGDGSSDGRFDHEEYVGIGDQFELHAGELERSLPRVAGQRPAVGGIESVLAKRDASKLLENVGEQHGVEFDVQRHVVFHRSTLVSIPHRSGVFVVVVRYVLQFGIEGPFRRQTRLPENASVRHVLVGKDAFPIDVRIVVAKRAPGVPEPVMQQLDKNI